MLSCSCLSCAIVTASVDEGYSSDAVGQYTLPRACYITLQAHVIQHPCLFRDVQWWMMALPVILKLVVSAGIPWWCLTNWPAESTPPTTPSHLTESSAHYVPSSCTHRKAEYTDSIPPTSPVNNLLLLATSPRALASVTPPSARRLPSLTLLTRPTTRRRS
jgi:hypothetical protein